MKKLVFLSFVANEIRDVRPVIELSKTAYINVQKSKVFLEETEVNKEVKIPIYEKDGKISTKIRLKSEGGTYSNDACRMTAIERESVSSINAKPQRHRINFLG